MALWGSQRPLNAPYKSGLFLVNDTNPLPFKLSSFIRSFCDQHVAEQIKVGNLDPARMKRRLQSIVPEFDALNSKEQAPTRVEEFQRRMEIVETFNNINPSKIIIKIERDKCANGHILMLARQIFPFLKESLNVEEQKYGQLERFLSTYKAPWSVSLSKPVGSANELTRMAHRPHGLVWITDAPLDITQAITYIITCCKLISSTHKSLFDLFASEIPIAISQIYKELIMYAQGEPNTPDFYHFCDLLTKYFDPSYNGNCEHNALATLNWISVLKGGRRFDELTPENRLDFTLRVLFSNEGIEKDYIEIREKPNPLQNRLKRNTKENLKRMLAYLTAFSTSRYAGGSQARYKRSTDLVSHTLSDALNIIYAREGLTLVLGIRMFTEKYIADDTLKERAPIIWAEEMMVFKVLEGKLRPFVSLSGQRGSLSREGGLYIQATACDNAPECEGVFQELSQALEDRNYGLYRELIQNRLEEILHFYARFYDSQNFNDTSPIRQRDTDKMFRICAEELKKPRANLPLAIRHMTATIPGGIRRIYFTQPGEFLQASPVVGAGTFPQFTQQSMVCSPVVRPSLSEDVARYILFFSIGARDVVLS